MKRIDIFHVFVYNNGNHIFFERRVVFSQVCRSNRTTMDLSLFADKKICVAVSGGVDSVALLHYLKANEKKYGYRLCVVHCEHGIRGEESLADARFVADLCEKSGLESYFFSENCPTLANREKVSLETAARNFRRNAFREIVQTGKADFIATAHHLNDEAETVLFRLARGTSSGVRGMEEISGYTLRPFLSWTKSEILAYAAKNGLAYREDGTNADVEITRNKLRLEVLPKLEESVSGATKNIVRFAARYAADDDLLYEYAKNILFQEDEGYRVAFNEKKPLFCRACLLAVKGLGLEKDYTAVHLEDVFRLQSLERGAQITLPKDIVAEKRLNGVVFYKKNTTPVLENSPSKRFDKIGFDGGRYEVILSEEPIFDDNEWKILRFDEEKLPRDATFRFRKDGDYIQRFGGGKKTLKKFFNEKQIPVFERGRLPLVAGVDDEVLIVCGVEISEKIKIDESTRKVLYIGIRKKE